MTKLIFFSVVTNSSINVAKWSIIAPLNRSSFDIVRELYFFKISSAIFIWYLWSSSSWRVLNYFFFLLYCDILGSRYLSDIAQALWNMNKWLTSQWLWVKKKSLLIHSHYNHYMVRHHLFLYNNSIFWVSYIFSFAFIINAIWLQTSLYLDVLNEIQN